MTRAAALIILILTSCACGVLAIAFYTVVADHHGQSFANGWAAVLVFVVWWTYPKRDEPESPDRYIVEDEEDRSDRSGHS